MGSTLTNAENGGMPCECYREEVCGGKAVMRVIKKTASSKKRRGSAGI